MLPGQPSTIDDVAAALRAGTCTSLEMTEAALDHAAAAQHRLGAFVTLSRETALAAAERADRDLTAGHDLGPLHGVPLAIKDLIATKDAPTTANSRVLDPEWGRGRDAEVVARLRAAGAVIVGKATASEFACGEPDPEKGFPVPRNPWNTGHTAAGSSSGSAIAVASGFAAGAIGTDTGGSIRAPAAVNGITGLCVTYGRVPKSGVVPLCFSQDVVGPMARSAHDCALLLEVIAGPHPSDRTSSTVPVPHYSQALTGDVEGLRIGVPTTYFYDAEGIDAEVRDTALRALDVLAAAGASVREVDIRLAERAKEASYVITASEAFSYHRANLATRWSDYGRYTRPILVKGALLTSADYVQAQRVRTAFVAEMRRVFQDVDILVTPATATPAAPIDDIDIDRRFVAPNPTRIFNLAGLPAVAVPSGFSAAGLPVGLQIVGRPFAEAMVLTAADAYQRRTDWHLRRPPVR